MPVTGRFRLRRESRRAFLQYEVRSILLSENRSWVPLHDPRFASPRDYRMGLRNDESV